MTSSGKRLIAAANEASEIAKAMAEGEPMTTDTTEAVERPDTFLIVKRGLYYRPNSQGYTGVRDDAGVYTLSQVAAHFPNIDSPNQDGMTFVHLDDAPEYSEACFWDVKLNHQKRKAEAERDALRAQLEARTCPLGDDCDLTVAYMAGRSTLAAENAALRAEVERLRGDALHILGRAFDAITSGPFDASDERIQTLADYIDQLQAPPARAALDAKP
jgi:hypothetical protein